MSKQIAFVTYETPYAPAGGIAAVMNRLPAHMQRASGLKTIIITPYHRKIDRTTALATKECGVIKVDVGEKTLKLRLLRYDSEIPYYFLAPDNRDYFNGFPHPYLVAKNKKDPSSKLCRDSLVFGAAVVKALDIISKNTEWTVMLQDWEAVTTVLADPNPDESRKYYLTLHNSYDSPVTDDELMFHGIEPERYPGYTVLDRALPYLQETVFTVSDQFAFDITEDQFQSEVMAGHLKDHLCSRLLGIKNGPFVNMSTNISEIEEASQGQYQNLQQWKSDNREKALLALEKLSPSKTNPVWGDISSFDKDISACWFVMAGRDDTRQKGYDVAAKAAESFIESRGDARFFFFPIPGDEGLKGLSFLKKLATKFPKQVLVFPFIWREGFLSVLRGASYGLMPSLYEPFGMANEFYLNGTVGIGRATGGIIQQIVPLQSPSSFSHAAQVRSNYWHSSSSLPTGFLFRESDNLQSTVHDLRAINAAGYQSKASRLDRVQERSKYKFFQAMSNEMGTCLSDGVQIYKNRPRQYYKMLADGVQFIENSISWDRAAHEYVRNVGIA